MDYSIEFRQVSRMAASHRHNIDAGPLGELTYLSLPLPRVSAQADGSLVIYGV